MSIISKSDKIKSEYCCTVVQIGEIKPIEGKDLIGQTLVNGLSIVVRKDQVKEGDILFYAANETQLNEKFLSINNLFEDKQQNVDHEKRGYFNKYGRVRMIKLGGCPSMGYLFNLDELRNYCPNITEKDIPKVGDDFDMVNGEIFVKAFVPPIKNYQHRSSGNKRGKKLAKFDRMIPGEFAFHYDTSQLNRCINQIQPTDLVTITTKVHGCVDANTLINTNKGQFTIKEIVDKKMDVLIEAFDFESKQKVFVPIDQYYTIPNDGDWYEIELENGIKLIITGNNPVYLPELNCYRKVWDLKIGDSVLIS